MIRCNQCTKEFEVTDADREFYAKIRVPEPTLCPACRDRRRLAFRNERTLYRRKCDKTGKDIISFYAPNAPVVVYDQSIWWGDSWDPTDYGRAFDFSRPFFEQFAELQRVVPHFSLYNMNPINSEYVNFALNNMNCYMCFSSVTNEGCLYCSSTDDSRDCIDCIYTNDQSELCYYAIDSSRCYRSLYIQDCSGCSDSYFCNNCSNCDHCFGCTNLRNASYYWFNEKVTPKEYEHRLHAERLSSFSSITRLTERFAEHSKKFPHKYAQITTSEESAGNYLYHTARCTACFDVHNAEDCSFMARSFNIKDCYDSYGIPDAELVYEAQSNGHSSNARFSIMSPFSIDIQYCEQCYNAQELFGCIGLRKKQNCILNKQYTKDEYGALVEKIVSHMKETGEYGEFFPASMSPFGYNETVALEMYPLTREQALAKGYRWQDELQSTRGKETLPSSQIPDDIVDVKEEILQQILACSECQRNFKLVKQELAFYKKFSIPIPHLCHDCRYKEHLSLRQPRKLFDGRCMCVIRSHDHGAEQCPHTFQTSYPAEAQRIVYCEQCYQKEVI